MRGGPEHRTRQLLGLLLAATLTACAAAGTSPSVPAVASPASASPSAFVQASERPAPSKPAAACLDEALPDSPGLVSGSFAEVVTDDLVLRRAPRIADDSRILGKLNAPAHVYVNGGPVDANGYQWWEVVPEGGNHDNIGWVAAAGKDGEEWLRPLPRREGTWTVIERRDVLGAVPAVGRVGTGAEGRLFFFGGNDGSMLDSQPTHAALAFDPATCGWEELPPLPVAQRDGLHIAQTPDGSFHAIAAERDTSGDASISVHLVFDPVTRGWERREAVPDVVDYGSAVVADGDGRLWTFGDEIHRYDEAPGSWTRVPTPTPWTHGVDGAVLQGDGSLALLFTGTGGIWRYGPDSASASLIVRPRVARYEAELALLYDGTMVLGGGYLTGSCTGTEEPPTVPPSPHYGLLDTYSPATGRWLSITPPRMASRAVVPVVVGGSLYVIGLEEQVNSYGSDPVLEKAELVVARFTPLDDATDGQGAEPGAGGCGG